MWERKGHILALQGKADDRPFEDSIISVLEEPMNVAMVPPSDPFRLRGLAIALDRSHVSETQDGFYPSGLFAGITSVLGSKEGRVAMADAPHRTVDVKEKAISAAGAAIISAVIVNPLDVAKVRLEFALQSYPIHSSCFQHDYSR